MKARILTNKKELKVQEVKKQVGCLEKEIAHLYSELSKQEELEFIRSTMREINLRQIKVDGLKESLLDRKKPCMEAYHI